MRVQQTWQASAQGLATRLRNDGSLERAYDQALADIRARYPLPPLAGPTDIYSVGQSVLLANGLDWAPRPVFQSYSAYSPSLERENAAHLKGEGAPENILFSIEPIDSRLPALEDGLSWPALLSDYQVTELRSQLAQLHSSVAVLRRREERTDALFAGARVAVGNYGLGQQIVLPSEFSALWANIDLEPTLLGRLIAFAFRPPLLRIVFRFPGGREEAYRYISTMGRPGFLLSPVIQDTPQFVALGLPGARLHMERVPISFRIEGTKGTGLLWEHALSLELRAVQLPVQPSVERVPAFSPRFQDAADLVTQSR